MTRYIPTLLLSISSLCAHAQYQEYTPPSNAISEYYRHDLEQRVMTKLSKIDWNSASKPTLGEVTIPVVVHVLHNNTATITDDQIYAMIDNANSYLLKKRPDTINIINKYKSIAASTKIKLKLATIDPAGNATKGVDRIYTYLTHQNNAFQEQSKINQWPQDKYLNIWLIDNVGLSAGYAITPYIAAIEPYYDGIVFLKSYTQLHPAIVPYLLGKYLGLLVPCSYGPPASCSDNDGIPDTPPCLFISSACANVYDTTCDTPNLQNIMYGKDSCSLMFTYGQGQYMQQVLQSPVGNRDNLIKPANFGATGMHRAMPDLPPVADYTVILGTLETRFGPIGRSVYFQDRSWNDTIVARSWSFSNNAAFPTATASTVTNHFNTPGWVTASLSVTGNNSGTTTLTDTHAFYVADTTPTQADGYVQDFAPGGDADKWPFVNYYHNSFSWQPANAGYLDNNSIMYSGCDLRTFPANQAGTPQGDYDDLFTPAFDLTSFAGNCYFNFMSTGASGTLDTHFRRDSLQISYSTNMGISWIRIQALKANDFCNAGFASGIPYVPTSAQDWIPQSISLPAAAIKNKVVFRLRYFPGADSFGVSTGNNLYLDKFSFGNFPATIPSSSNTGQDDVQLFPNPAHNGTTLIISGKVALSAITIQITDIAGKEIYRHNSNNAGTTYQLHISKETFPATGMYLLHIISVHATRTEKIFVD